jgi:hypothetical protein
MSEIVNEIATGLQIYSKIKTILTLIFFSIIFLCIFIFFIRSQIYYDILGKNGKISYKKIVNNEYIDCIEKNLSGCEYYTEYTDNYNKIHIKKYMDDIKPTTSSEIIDPKKIAISRNIYYSNVDTNNFSFTNRSATTSVSFLFFGSCIILIVLIVLSLQLYLITINKQYGVISGINSIYSMFNNNTNYSYNRGIQLRF